MTAIAVVVGHDPGGGDALAAITVGDVDRRERELRASPAATRLPAAGSSEGRQLRRWIAHCLAAEAVVDAEIAARGPADPGPELAVAGVSGALGAGSVALAVLTRSAPARRFAAGLTADVRLAPDRLDRLAAGHPVLPARPVRHRVDGVPVNGGRPVRVRAAELPPELAAALGGARTGDVLHGRDSVGRHHELTVLGEPGSPAPDRSRDGAEAVAAARARAFGRWLDARRDVLVHARPGFEHPADPHQPDNTHRH